MSYTTEPVGFGLVLPIVNVLYNVACMVWCGGTNMFCLDVLNDAPGSVLSAFG